MPTRTSLRNESSVSPTRGITTSVVGAECRMLLGEIGDDAGVNTAHGMRVREQDRRFQPAALLHLVQAGHLADTVQNEPPGDDPFGKGAARG